MEVQARSDGGAQWMGRSLGGSADSLRPHAEKITVMIFCFFSRWHLKPPRYTATNHGERDAR